MTEKRVRQKPGDANYVNNKEFSIELDKYARAQRKQLAEGKGRIQMNNYLADCIMRMSKRLASTKRFSGYPFKDEMIQNAILAAVKYSHGFNGDKFDNGFAYVTQILFSHMVITIKNEKQKYETNMKLIQQFAEDLDEHGVETDIRENFIRSIADQKLASLESSRKSADEPGSAGKGFQLRTGYTKEERDAYDGGTPMNRDYEDDDDE